MYSFLDTSESDVFVESRCIWNIWFLEHTSGMHDLGPVRCIVELVSVGDTSGLRFQFPSRCTEVQIYLINTSGWANIGYFRCIAKNHQNKIHRNSTIYGNPDAFQLISRDATYTPSQHIPAQVNFKLISREYTCIPSQPTPARINLTLIPAIFLPYLWVGAVLHGV